MINKGKNPKKTASKEKDCTFGGSHYRLEYDMLEENKEQHRAYTKDSKKKKIAFFICAAVLIVSGLLIWRYASNIAPGFFGRI